MGDVSDKGSECEDMMMMSPEGYGSISSDGGNSSIKTCVDCGTSKTPLWRSGPAGHKSLCNACGIKSRKRRWALLGVSTKDDIKLKKPTTAITTTTKDDTKPKKITITITTTTKDDTKPKKTTATISTTTKDDTKPKKTTTIISTTTKDDTKPKKTTTTVSTTTKDDTKPKKTSTTTTSAGDSQNSGVTTIYKSDYMGDLCLKKRIMALGSEVRVQRPRSKVTKHRRKPSEEVKAAYLLMAISCGSVFA